MHSTMYSPVCVVEIFHSLILLQLNDLIGFIVAFAALKVRNMFCSLFWLVPDEKQISAKKDSPQDLSFGWQRSRLLGAFFNSVFLLALGVSIFLQSIERFVSVQGVWCIRRQHVILLIKSQSWNSQNSCSSLVVSAWLSILSAPHSCMV